MRLVDIEREVVVVVGAETNLDLLKKETRFPNVGFIAVGDLLNRPGRRLSAVLKQKKVILVALGGDECSVQEAWEYWLKYFPNAKRWPPIDGNDIFKMFGNGVDLALWLEAGLMECGVIIAPERRNVASNRTKEADSDALEPRYTLKQLRAAWAAGKYSNLP